MLQITISKRSAFLIVLALLLLVPAVAFAGSVFDDVDDTDTHIDGITFMKDSGVSIGCDTNNNYCPQDNVTRAQMATFMYRLSGNDPATAPSVAAATADDSDTVDGLDSTQFTPAVFALETGSGTVETTPAVQTQVDFTLPDRCSGPDLWSVRVTGSGYFLTGSNPSTSATVGVTVDDATDFAAGAINNQNLDGPGQNREQFFTEFIFELDAGDHTAYLLADASSVTPFVSTNLTKLIVQSVAVDCS